MITFRRLGLTLLIICAAEIFSSDVLEARQIRLRMGTIVPRGSAWHETLLYIRQEWRKLSDGDLDLIVIPGGQLGDEIEMVRKMRAGVIHAVALSSGGLSNIDDSVLALQVPMMFASYEEFDYVRDRIIPKLEERIESKGFQCKMLFWSDGGWVHMFSKKLGKTPQDVQRMKLFTSAGDPETENLWRSFGFSVVPLAPTDILTSLQGGMITAVDVPPLLALFNRIYTEVPFMMDLKLAPLVGGAVISKRAWDRIPEQYHAPMLEIARKAALKLRGEIRRLGSEAVDQMKRRGLTVTSLDEQSMRAWQTLAEGTYAKLRGTYCPKDLFDEVKRLRDNFRTMLGRSSLR